ncbi:MAG TPA: amino acid-binding protein, partial [Pseudolysinimonas sp.]|nr:amino acid-binding protein [Pseudolysinimonas sp.]
TEGTDVDLIAAATFDPGDPNLESKVGELAASGAGVLLSIVSLASLQVGVLSDAHSIGWAPEVFLPSNSSSPVDVVIPGGGAGFPAVYSTAFAKLPGSPDSAVDEDVVAYAVAFEQYGSGIAATYTPHCAWSYAEGAILEQAFLAMTKPTRASFMEALFSIEGYEAPLLLDGVAVNTTDPSRPAIRGLTLVQFNGTGYGPVQ